MNPAYLRALIHLALKEDLGAGDVTSDHLIPSSAKSQARLIAKSSGVICGLEVAREVFKTLQAKVVFHSVVADGYCVRHGDVLAHITGSTRALLAAERVSLNLLSLLSGIATQTRCFVERIKPYTAAIMDTRKTTPLLRQLERYAVRVGGGVNHRFNLNAMAMIKDNHRVICATRDMNQVIKDLKKKIKKKVEVEVDTLAQFKEILHSKADIVLLDNMSPRQIAQAVAMRDQAKSTILLEASGGITLKNVKRYAATGVDRISIGALTHARQALDISMEFVSSS